MPAMRVQVRLKPDRTRLQLFYVDPYDGKERTRSAKTKDWGEAERAARTWETELETGQVGRNLSWDNFCARVYAELVERKKPSTASAYRTAIDRFEELMGAPRSVMALDSSTMSRYSALLESKCQSRETARKHLRHLKAMFRWAEKIGILPRTPAFIMPRPGDNDAKGRAITESEFVKMLDKLPGIVGKEYAAGWEFLLRGLWLSALRLSEALALSYDSLPVWLKIHEKPYPTITWAARGQKSGKLETCPITPDFAELLATSRHESGPVFRPEIARRKIDLTLASKTITAIGQAAGIIVSEEGKHGSAHDFRRSFGSRWAMKVPPMVLQKMMRHRDIKTTLKYYVSIDVADLGAVIWGGSVQIPVQNPEQAETQPARKPPRKARLSKKNAT